MIYDRTLPTLEVRVLAMLTKDTGNIILHVERNTTKHLVLQ